MEYASLKLVEAATHRSLHAAGFSRSSTHASSPAKYAQHAGRTTLTTTDALEALDDLGFGLQDLIDYVPEAKDLSRYAIYSGRRVEELNEFKAQLGRVQRDDAFPLTYAPYDEEDQEEDIELQVEPEPPQKRQRTLDWDGHIPDFLPPFPTITDAPESPESRLQLACNLHLRRRLRPASTLRGLLPRRRLPMAPPRTTPTAPRSPPSPSATTTAVAQALNPELALYKAFHHILTNPTREPTAPSPARHRVAMGLLQHAALVPRWELPDTMYAASAPAPPPRLAHRPHLRRPRLPPPTAATEIAPPTRRFPPTHRTVAAPSQIAPLVYARVTRLAHPPPLARGSKILKYGQGAPAPWNAGTTGAGADGDGDGGKGEEDKKIPDARVYATWEYESKDFRVGIKKPRGPAVQQQPPQPGRRSSRAVG
ncbi:hypothetical protein B0H14DRAFT_3586370 [Mycena olivaceomarginata]|nr:hypothetical protein B0H14DRAFT_3586370 [Mycena olivaceomarginata]